MNPPDLSFRSNKSPFAQLTSIIYKQTKQEAPNDFPVLEGEVSDSEIFRIYNNFTLATGVADAINVSLTTFDYGSRPVGNYPMTRNFSADVRGNDAIAFTLKPSVPNIMPQIEGSVSAYATPNINTTPFTLSHTIPAGLTDSILIVTLNRNSYSETTIPTWNGTEMTLLYNNSGLAQDEFIDIFYLLNPEPGTHDVVVVPPAPTKGQVCAVTLSGVNQTTPSDAVGYHDIWGDENTETIILTTVTPESFILDISATDDDTKNHSVPAGQTIIAEAQTDAWNGHVSISKLNLAISPSCLKIPVYESWIHVFEKGFGEGSGGGAMLTFYEGEDTAIGGCPPGANFYIPEQGSDGSATPQIRAGSDNDGMGFLEIKSYARVPDGPPNETFQFSIVIEYDYVV